MAADILFLMAGYNMKSQAIANEVRKMQAGEGSRVKATEASRMQANEASEMHASIPARICFLDVGDTVIDYGRARELFEFRRRPELEDA